MTQIKIDIIKMNQEATMISKRTVTAIIEREGNGYVSMCPEFDIASQGDTIEESRDNLVEAVELFLETASPAEIDERLHEDVLISRLEVSVGTAA